MNITMRTGTTKSHTPGEGYGFIAGSDGREYYFAANSVLDGAAGAVMVGMTVCLKPNAISKGVREVEVLNLIPVFRKRTASTLGEVT
ncbi:hypothetical protein QAO71_17370 (plasmid) [Halopseudomonas sp. SMJS2]|uniref:hypothetical protein n=1 Tax=Halopseudomonas sp. SMJS2 TaxID=3041098 RepID=UPI002452CD32|nr:hypothetical protein [Halopseudomonas sp. SMJS2]WGK63539.1 hypothetical protein QAO71_17370 [Halopseudomonas sp. SMJS2]